MTYTYLLFFLIISFSNLYSQDIILKKDGKSIESKIDEIGIDKIKYHKYGNLSGPVFIILKNDVSKITFENGDVELINTVNEFNIDEIKKIIVDSINEYGFEKTSYKLNYRVEFYDDYLWLKIFNRKGKQLGYNAIYDLSMVYKFDEVSKREDDLAFVNIFASKLRSNPIKLKKGINIKWVKDKLVIRVKGHKNADNIMNAIKEYNRLLNLNK